MKSVNLKIAITCLGFVFFSTTSLRAQFPDNLDIIILVDVSGSMEYALLGAYPVPTADQRFSYVEPGLQALVTVFGRLADPVFGGGGGVSNRKFAIGRFPGNDPDPFTWLEENAANNSNLRDYDTFDGDTELPAIIGGLTIRWAGTPIGTAIIDALQMFINFGDSPSLATGSVILLFTDGKRHNGAEIYKTGLSSGSVNNVREAEISDHIDHPDLADTGDKIKIVSLGFGDYTGAGSETDFDMLDDISIVAAGRFNPFAASVLDFTKATIYNAFSAMGYGFALVDPSFFIRPNEIQEHMYPVTEYDQRLLFVVSWSEPMADSTLQFTLRDALGQIIDPATAGRERNIAYDLGRTFQMYTIGTPYLQNNVGEWTLIVNGNEIVESQYYSYSVLGHSGLQLRDATIPQQRAQFTGDKIQAQVSLTADGNPIPNAIVTAQVTGPELGAGNWFAEFPLTPSQLDSVRGIQFPGFVEDVYKKFYYMNLLNNVALPGTNTFEIIFDYDEQDSLYKGMSEALTRPGAYRVEVTAKNDSSGNITAFRRDLLLNYNIKVRPNLDWTISSLEFEKITDPENPNIDIYRLKFTPKDRFQNFVKPGKADNIKFQVKNASLSGQPIADDLQGSYFKNIRVPRSSLKPTVKVQFRDFVFQERPITDNPTADNWRFCLNAISFHAGSVMPTGTADSLYKSGLHASIDYYRQISKHWAVNAFVGYSKFKGKSSIPDLEYWDFSANIRWYPLVLPAFRFFMNAGGGYYRADQSSNSGVGINAGAGFNIPISSRVDLEIGSDYHNIFMDPANFEFVRSFGGLLIRF